jgi:hypothetical protein
MMQLANRYSLDILLPIIEFRGIFSEINERVRIPRDFRAVVCVQRRGALQEPTVMSCPGFGGYLPCGCKFHCHGVASIARVTAAPRRSG